MQAQGVNRAGCGLLCGAIHGADCMYDSAAEHVNADRTTKQSKLAGQSYEDDKPCPTGCPLAV